MWLKINRERAWKAAGVPIFNCVKSHCLLAPRDLSFFCHYQDLRLTSDTV